MTYFKKALILAAILAVGSGCSAVNLATSEFNPTHRWARPDTTIAQYNFHNVRCVEASKMNLDGTYAGSSEFLAYRDCMENRGFELMALASSVSADRHPE